MNSATYNLRKGGRAEESPARTGCAFHLFIRFDLEGRDKGSGPCGARYCVGSSIRQTQGSTTRGTMAAARATMPRTWTRTC